MCTRSRLVFGLEAAIVAAVDIVVHLAYRAEWFFPLLAIIVGPHFLPLAHVSGGRGYYATGAILWLTAIYALLQGRHALARASEMLRG